jgi:hypothetical protein
MSKADRRSKSIGSIPSDNQGDLPLEDENPDFVRKLLPNQAARLLWDVLQAKRNYTAALDDWKVIWADLNSEERERAYDELQEMFKSGGPPPIPYLEEQREAFVSGDNLALPNAIRACAMGSVPLPAWAAIAFVNGFFKVERLEVESWSDILGWPHPKGVHRGRLRKRQKIGSQVWTYVVILNYFGRRLDKGLFEDVGACFGIGATLCEQLYRAAEAKYGDRPRAQRKSRKSPAIRGKTPGP